MTWLIQFILVLSKVFLGLSEVFFGHCATWVRLFQFCAQVSASLEPWMGSQQRGGRWKILSWKLLLCWVLDCFCFNLSCQCWCRLLKLVPQDLLLADERRFALGGGCRGHPRRLRLLFANCPYEFLVSKNLQWHHRQDKCRSPLFPFLSTSWKRKAGHLWHVGFGFCSLAWTRFVARQT